MKNKYCSLVRATLPALFVISALMLNTSVRAQPSSGNLWYNGDFNNVNGLANERNTLITQVGVYNDFNGPSGTTWNIAAVFSDNLANRFYRLSSNAFASVRALRGHVSSARTPPLCRGGST